MEAAAVLAFAVVVAAAMLTVALRGVAKALGEGAEVGRRLTGALDDFWSTAPAVGGGTPAKDPTYIPLDELESLMSDEPADMRFEWELDETDLEPA